MRLFESFGLRHFEFFSGILISIDSLRISTMDDTGNIKMMGIRQIARLKEKLQKWQTVTISPKPNSPSSRNISGISPVVNRRLTGFMYCDSDEDGCASPQPPPDVPKGYLAVYVGPELRRFIIPTSYLSHSLFKLLLEKAEEEFGFYHCGGLTIPCEIETFKFLLKCIENNEKAQNDDN